MKIIKKNLKLNYINLQFYNKHYWGLLHLSLVGVIVLFFYLLLKSYSIAPDSEGYISNYAIRPPLYPLILDFFKLVSAFNYLALTFYFQLIFGFFLITYTFIKLVKLFKLPSIFHIVFFFILFHPYIFYPAIGNRIITEAIAYPLFIYLCLWIVKFLLVPDKKSFLLIIITTCLLILTRGQFKYLLLVLPFVFFVFFYLNKGFENHVKYILLISVTSIILLFVIIRGYHYLYNDHFKSEPGMGIWMAVPALYISNIGDTTVLETKLEKQWFTTIYKRLDSNNLTIKTFRKTNNSTSGIAEAYAKSWNDICWKYSYPLKKKIIKDNSSNSVYLYDKFLFGIASKLIIKNWKDFLSLFVKNLINSFDGTKYFILIMSILLLNVRQLFKYTKSNTLIVPLAILIISLSNNIFISILLFADTRVLIYSTAIINVLLILFSYFALYSFSKYMTKIYNIL